MSPSPKLSDISYRRAIFFARTSYLKNKPGKTKEWERSVWLSFLGSLWWFLFSLTQNAVYISTCRLKIITWKWSRLLTIETWSLPGSHNDVSMGSLSILDKKSYTRIFRTGRFDCINGTTSVCRFMNKSFQSRLVRAAPRKSDFVPLLKTSIACIALRKLKLYH